MKELDTIPSANNTFDIGGPTKNVYSRAVKHLDEPTDAKDAVNYTTLQDVITINSGIFSQSAIDAYVFDFVAPAPKNNYYRRRYYTYCWIY